MLIKSTLFVILIFFIGLDSYAAEFHKCIDASGKTVFSDKQCAENAERFKVKEDKVKEDKATTTLSTPAGPFQEGMAAYDRGDFAAAARWWRQAAEQGLAVAQLSIGRLYEQGRGVAQDSVQALMWVTLAAASLPAGEKDHRTAVELMNQLSAQMTPAQIEEAKRRAREWKPTAGPAPDKPPIPMAPAPVSKKQPLGPVVAEARQGKCHLWAEGQGQVFSVGVEGLEPGESIETESTSNGETISTMKKARADGTWGVALFPAVLGKHSGTVTFTIKSSRCHLAIEFPWHQ